MFYTYLWLRNDGTPYYVGKGKEDRAYTSAGHRVRCPEYDRILVQDFLCEQDALVAEVFLISYYGRQDLGTGCLRNLTDGGDGWSGPQAIEHIQKRVSKNIGQKRSGAVRKRMSRSAKARWKRNPFLRPTHCKRNHEFSVENTYTHSTGGRCCRICSAFRAREKRARLKKRN